MCQACYILCQGDDDLVSPDELKLNVTAGPSAGTDFCKPGVHRLTVGRTQASKVWIKDSAVSEKHAEIYWDNQAWVLQDKGSSNGTLLNGIALVAGGEPCKSPVYCLTKQAAEHT